MILYLSDQTLLKSLQTYNISPAAWSSKIVRNKIISEAQDSIILCQQSLVSTFLNTDPKETKVKDYIKKNLQLDWDGSLVPLDLLWNLAKGLKTIVHTHPTPSQDDLNPTGKIQILLSSTSAPGGYNDPSSWKRTHDLIAQFYAMVANVSVNEATKIVNSRLTCKRIMGNQTVYNNHAKVVCVDQALLYVGSDNAYPQYNEQHGVWIEDKTNISAWNENYWRGA